jgi:hypothetical protein
VHPANAVYDIHKMNFEPADIRGRGDAKLYRDRCPL